MHTFPIPVGARTNTSCPINVPHSSNQNLGIQVLTSNSSLDNRFLFAPEVAVPENWVDSCQSFIAMAASGAPCWSILETFGIPTNSWTTKGSLIAVEEIHILWFHDPYGQGSGRSQPRHNRSRQITRFHRLSHMPIISRHSVIFALWTHSSQKQMR